MVYALTRTFIQTDWSGGADGSAAVTNPTDTNWDNFFSADNSLDSEGGNIKLKVEISQP